MQVDRYACLPSETRSFGISSATDSARGLESDGFEDDALPAVPLPSAVVGAPSSEQAAVESANPTTVISDATRIFPPLASEQVIAAPVRVIVSAMSPDLVTARDSARWGTLANLLTLGRVVCVPLLAVAVVGETWFTAFGLFWLAVATDFADGRLARSRGEASNLGGLLDHSADALFCSVGLGALAWLGIVPTPLPFLVALAFLQYMLDSRSIAGRRLRASLLGRWNGIFYFVLVGIPIVRDTLGLAWPGAGLVMVIGWALVVSTLVSMGDRAWAFVSSRR